MANIMLRFPAVKLITGKFRMGIYVDTNRDKFPKAISIGDRAEGWLQTDIDQWLHGRVEISRSVVQPSAAKCASGCPPCRRVG